MTHIGQVPSWWLDMAKTWRAQDMLDLLEAVNRAGVSKNDKPAVERIWHDLQVAKAFKAKPPENEETPS